MPEPTQLSLDQRRMVSRVRRALTGQVAEMCQVAPRMRGAVIAVHAMAEEVRLRIDLHVEIVVALSAHHLRRHSRHTFAVWEWTWPELDTMLRRPAHLRAVTTGAVLAMLTASAPVTCEIRPES